MQLTFDTRPLCLGIPNFSLKSLWIYDTGCMVSPFSYFFVFSQDGHRVEDYFERVFLSYKMHLVKPSAEIFRQVISETGITAEETLFIDDSPANCQTACQLGIHTLLNTTADEWLHKI